MRWVALVALAVLAAGCLDDGQAAGEPKVEDLPASAVQPDDSAGLGSDGATATFAPPASPSAGGLARLVPGSVVTWSGACPCPAYRFDLAAGDGWDGWLEVRLAWDGSAVADLDLKVLGPELAAVSGERGFDDRLARVWDPASGSYQVMLTGSGAFRATARLGSLDVPDEGALLPNLVELVIEGPYIGTCDEVERTEQGAVKCMRFGNGVGNPGNGPVQIRLTVEQAAQALAPMQGRFVQEIVSADGSVSEHPVGPATFHVAHSHWHYDGLAVFDLYAVDEETGLRGDKAATHGKSGFCFLDWDRMPENTTEPAERERAEADCLVPGLSTLGSASVPAWTNGISRGWYDFYESGLSDQYVDVDGLPDGLYELVASADPLQTLDELDETDNQSSLLLRLSGDDVEVVEERGHYRVQEDDDA